MGLLKFHFAFSVLCMLTIFGFNWVFGKAIKENGWERRVKGGPLICCLIRLRNTLVYALCAFIPVINVAIPWLLLYMAVHENPEQGDA